MDIDIRIDDTSLPISVGNPFTFNQSAMLNEIVSFGSSNGVDLRPFHLDQLITRMIKGVAGCEAGCPSDAKGLARDGFGQFALSYVEGGILTAKRTLEDGRTLEVKVFPDFD